MRVLPRLCLAAVAVLALTGLNALLVAGRLAVEWTAVVTVAEAIGGGPLGGLLLALLQIGWLPTFTAWSIAWTAGPGFSVGADSLYSVFGATPATAPALPALGALPGTWSPWQLLLLAVPIGAGAVAGVAVQDVVEPHQRQDLLAVLDDLVVPGPLDEVTPSWPA